MYQFIHIESYSRTAPKTAQHKNKKSGKQSGKKGGHCVSYIVKEAIRDPDSIPHIDSPQPPIYHHGKPLEALESTCDEWASSMTDARGHKLRKDALCLVAGVASAPHDISKEAWIAFRADLIKWLQEKYGERLQTIIEHTDESHPHLHFYVVPLPGERFEVIHQGKAAAAEAKASGELKGEQNKAYKEAMREFQDEFYNDVGIEHGFTRIGPGKRRLTREEWKLEQIQAAAAAHAISKATETVTLSETEAKQIKDEARSEARKIAEITLKKADEIEQKAAKKGFNEGLNRVEKLPWWEKIGAVLSRAVRERDELREKVKVLESEKTTWMSKAKKFFSIGKKVSERLKEVEPKLKDVQIELSRAKIEAREAVSLRKKNDQLAGELSSQKSRNAHLEAAVESLTERLEPEKTPAVARVQRDAGSELSL